MDFLRWIELHQGLATWVSGLGSLAAAIAAMWAATKAAKLAKISIEQQERDRISSCRSIAPAIGPEFRRAAEEARALSKLLTTKAEVQSLRSWSNQGFLLRTSSIERWLGKFDLFGGADGAQLSKTAAAILNLRARVQYWIELDRSGRRPVTNITSLLPIPLDPGVRRPLEAEANMVVEYVRQLEPILAQFGGGKSIHEA